MDLKILEKDIIDLLGLKKLPAEQQTKLTARMAEVILDRITLRILDELSEEDKAGLDLLLQKKAKPQEIDAFLAKKVKNLDEIRTAEILRFKQDIVQDTEHLTQNLTAQKS